jgi:hypothetical protein
MSYLASYYFSDLLPYSVCVDWPYAYVVGSKAGAGGNYTMESRKLRIDSGPITLEDSYTYLTKTVWTYLFSVRLNGNYLYMAGGYNAGTEGSKNFKHKVIKVDKTNLSNVIWNHDETPYVPTLTCYIYDAMPNSADTLVACIGNNDYAQSYKLDASNGAKLANDFLAGSEGACFGYAILGFYSSDSYVDITGQRQGQRVIWRYLMSSWSKTRYASGYASCYGGELYNAYYYLGGNYYASGNLWQKPVWKVPQSDINNITWGRYRDDKTGTIYEDNQCSTVDGPGGYVYTVGRQYTGPGNYDPPVQGTLSKYDLDGNFQWAVNFGDNDYPPSPRSIVNYGNYLILVENNAASAGTGWLRLRNKSDGAIAYLESAPTGGTGAFFLLF